MPPEDAPATTLDALKPELLARLNEGSVVLSAPTGSGKSTHVPRWLAGKVLVIEPRRVACRALAARVAALEGTPLGQNVGYRVKNDDCTQPETRIVFATPGIVLADAGCLADYDWIVLDEFHERRLDTDWLLAYLAQKKRRVLVMSATIAGDAIAEHLGGVHLTATVRAFTVQTHYLGAQADLPEGAGLTERIARAVSQAQPAGDILVFLPGKSEIRQAHSALSHLDFELFDLHGGLTLADQSEVFRPTARRKLILSTNVAETSVTLPGVKTVIDSGLVRRTAYHGGRGYLTLSAIAMDSAEQRQGRAGRTGPGECFRLWGQAAMLGAVTPPEIYRESLVPFLLWSAAHNVSIADLRCLDAPKAHALADATSELQQLQALDDQGLITERGRSLHRIPLDPWYGRLLVEAQGTGQLEPMLDLVAALAQTPPIALPPVDQEEGVAPCDATALVHCLRAAPTSSDHWALKEARQSRSRLRQWFGLQGRSSEPFDRKALLSTILRADPASAHVARVRKQRTTFSGGGPELELARDSRAGFAKQAQAIVVLGTRAAISGRKKLLIATRASAVSFKLLEELELGSQRVGQVSLKSGKVKVSAERVLAGKVIATRDLTPEGELLRSAVAQLFLRGSLYQKALHETKRRLQRRRLLYGLSRAPGRAAAFPYEVHEPPTLEAWLEQRLQELGLGAADELELLSETDFVCDDVGAEVLPMLESEFPLQLDLGDCLYDVQYDLPKRQVILSIVRGKRSAPPPRAYLPRFSGFKVFAEAGGTLHPLKPRA